MRKTLLLVFIHGFKGGENTFEQFPEHLRILISDALPQLNVLSIVYPKFETRGDLYECAGKFKEWLQDKVIDFEVAAKTPAPTIDPSVRVILVGHSMGGIVAAETLISIAQDEPVPSARREPPARPSSARPDDTRNRTTTTANATSSSTPAQSNSPVNLAVPPLASTERSSSAPPSSKPVEGEAQAVPGAAEVESPPRPEFLFPFVQGLLAFDTPYLGIHPGVVAHNAETHYNTASAAMTAYNNAAQLFGWGSKSAAEVTAMNSSRALPAASVAQNGGWGRYALFAGGAAALAAAGGAAYYSKEHITSGWNWISSHLVFVGCLARGAELTQRLEKVIKLSDRYGIGFADVYTRLGSKKGATKIAGELLGEERTFCVVPKEAKQADKSKEKHKTKDQNSKQDYTSGGESPSKRRKVAPLEIGKKGTWIESVDAKSGDEITAHRAMFTPSQHPGYYAMSEKARNLIVSWVDRGWLAGSVDDADDEMEQEQVPAT